MELNESFYRNLSFIAPYLNRFVLTLSHHFFFCYGNSYFTLIRCNKNNYFSYDYLLYPPFLFGSLQLNWFDLWKKESSEYLTLYKNIFGKNCMIDESFPYFFSFLDYALFLIKDYNVSSNYLYVQHKSYESDFFCPLDIVFDFKERDIANYLKYLFFSGKDYQTFLLELFHSNQANLIMDLIIAQLFYPDYYFNAFKKYSDGVEDALLSIKKVIYLQQKYLLFVRDFVLLFEKKYSIKKSVYWFLTL